MSVGYGLNQAHPTSYSLRERWHSVSFLINLTNSLTDGFNIQTSNNPGRWPEDDMAHSGGTCYGDSGGPLFYTHEGVEYLVGITSFGTNPNCKGTDFAYRTDTISARSFIDQYQQ
jgi:secreted trypsin-like serine protease